MYAGWIMMNVGDKIVVYDGQKVELGEGTFIRRTLHPDLRMTAYECNEHTILAKGAHYVKVRGRLIPVNPDFGAG
jgi:hypothetical protein